MTIFSPRQNRPVIEAEPVHMHLLDPIAQAIRNQLHHKRMVALARVATTRIIHIPLLVLRVEHIVDLVINALETDGGTPMIALTRMVKNDVQNHFDPCLMERLDHVAKVPQLASFCGSKTIGRMGSKVSDRVVSPEALEGLAIQWTQERNTVLIEGKDRQQFDCRNAQFLEIGNLLDKAHKGPRMLAARGRRSGKSAHV